MNRRGAGVVFCLIAALLYSTNYLSAAIYSSDLSPRPGFVDAMLEYTGNNLVILSTIFLAVGITYLISADWQDILNFCRANFGYEKNPKTK